MRLRLVIPLIVLLCLAASGFVGANGVYARLSAARHAVEQGAHEMRQAEAQLGAMSRSGSASLAFSRARTHTARASADFHSADREVHSLAPILDKMSWLPGVGPELVASPHVIRLAVQVTNGTQQTLDGLDPVVSLFKPGQAAGSARTDAFLTGLDAAHGSFHRSYQLLQQAKSTRSLLQGPQPSVIAGPLHTLDEQLPHLVTLDLSLMLLPELFGYNRQQTYLLAFNDVPNLGENAGFNGSVGVLGLRNGASVREFNPVYVHRHRTPVDAVQVFDNSAAWLTDRSSWLPDTSTMALLQHVVNSLHASRQRVNGVVELTDPVAATLLSMTGPVYSPVYRTWITSKNVVRLIRYYDLAPGHQPPGAAVISRASHGAGLASASGAPTTRTPIVKIVADHVLARFPYLSLPQLIRLGNALTPDVGQHHVFLDFRDSREQQLAQALGTR